MSLIEDFAEVSAPSSTLSDKAVCELYADYYRNYHPNALEELFMFKGDDQAYELIYDIIFDNDRQTAQRTLFHLMSEEYRERVERKVENARDRLAFGTDLNA